jgi:tryptophan 2,3-dioxygenase
MDVTKPTPSSGRAPRTGPNPREGAGLGTRTGEAALPLNYARYLGLADLLRLQQPRSDPAEHDEMLFIVIHQTYELWFKLLLHELEKVKGDFSGGDLYGAIHTLHRCRTIMKTLVGQLDILETMTPMSFTSFRDRLETSSGFQSSQFRELEFTLGFKRANVIKFFKPDDPGWEPMQKRLRERSVVDHFYDFLAAQKVAIPEELRERDLTQANEPNATVQEGLLRLYTTRPDLAILFELMTDFDEGFQEWRYRHVKVVERTIGSKQGTGGSPGVEFLKKSLFLPVFADLWAIRHKL